MTSADEKPQRLSWVDTARGLCILAVVSLYAANTMEESMGTSGWGRHVADFLKPFRMPDFFLLSGVVGGMALHRPWRAFLNAKVVHYLYFYVLWVGLRVLVVPRDPTTGLVEAFFGALLQPPNGPIWFIGVLPLAFLALRATRMLPAWLILVAAVGLRLAEVPTGLKIFDRFQEYFVFVAAGALLSQHIIRIAQWAEESAKRTAALVGLWLVIDGVAVWSGTASTPLLSLALGLLGGGGVIFLSTLCSRVRPLGWLAALGAKSLPVYLAFAVPLMVLRRLLGGSSLLPLVPDVDLATTLAVIACISFALLLDRAVRGTPFRWLFERPKWLAFDGREGVASLAR